MKKIQKRFYQFISSIVVLVSSLLLVLLYTFCKLIIHQHGVSGMLIKVIPLHGVIK